MDAPRIQYTRSNDGTQIAYAVLGSGPPLLFVHTLFSGGLDIRFRARHWAPFYEALVAHHRVTLFDWRNSGLSGPASSFTAQSIVDDLESVIRASGLQHFDLWAIGGSIGIGVEYAALHPERLRKLILRPYRHPQGTGEAFAFGMSLAELASSDWDAFTELYALRTVGWFETGREWLDLFRKQWNPETLVAFMSAVATWDPFPRAASVQTETLVLVADGVPIERLRLAQRLAAALPKGHLIVGGSGPETHDPDQVKVADEFLADLSTADEPAAPTLQTLPEGAVVILFTDIVESTALTERLGDAAFRARARELDSSLRTLVRESGGTPVEGTLLGDGLLAVFTSARQAIDCALKCNAAAEGAGLQLHLGLHAGDVLREGNNVYGGAVNIAARIMSAAEPGQVLVSDTVRSLARTSAGVTFADQGEHALKGIADPVRVFEVSKAATIV